MPTDQETWLPLSEVVRNLGLVVAGFVALLFAGLRVRSANRQADASLRQAEAALNQAKVASHEQFADLFNRAVEQLDSDKLHVRLGAVLTMRQIIEDYPDLNPAVFELLNAYIQAGNFDYGQEQPPADVEAIFTILRAQLEEGGDDG